MPTSNIERLKKKINRKFNYLESIAIKFNDLELKHLILNLEEEYKQIDNNSNEEMDELSFETQNKKLKIMKKKFENLYFKNMSNTKAFFIKSELKNYPLIILLDKMIQKKETKANFPDFTDVNAKVYEYPQDILELEFQKILVKNNPSSEIKLEKINNFVSQIINNYNSVSYHNFSHAFSVAQMFYCLSKKSNSISKLLSSETIFIGLIACISHDLGHRKF